MITAWVVAFHQEAQTGDPLDAAKVTRDAVAKERVFIWDDRGAKSVATYASRTERSARIGLALHVTGASRARICVCVCRGVDPALAQ